MGLLDGFPSASGLASANDVRLGLAGLVVRDTTGSPRTGVFPRSTTALVTSTATMNSSVAAAEFVVSKTSQGIILLPNDGATNVLHSAAPVANSRYDIVYVKQFDAVAPNTDATSVPAFGVFAGPASAGPTPYTYATAKAALAAAVGIGDGAEPLAMVLIPSTATTMQSVGVVYTQLHRFTAATGGVIWFRNTTDRDAVTYAEGQLGWLMDTNALQRFDGTTWATLLAGVNMQMDTTNSLIVPQPQIGIGKIAGLAASSVNEAVTFPVAFAVGTYPVVVVSALGSRANGAFNPAGLSAAQSILCTAMAVSPTGFSAYLYQTTGSNLATGQDWYYSWIAFGVPA